MGWGLGFEEGRLMSLENDRMGVSEESLGLGGGRVGGGCGSYRRRRRRCGWV